LREVHATDRSPLAVAEICFSRSWSSLEHYFVETTLLLSRRGHKVVPLVYPRSPIANALTEARLPPIPIKSRRYFSPVASRRMVQVFHEHSITSVHLHRTQDLGPALYAADHAAVPTRVLMLQMESDRKKRDPYHRWVFKRLTTVLTVTDRMRWLVQRNVAVDPDKVRTLYYGFDLEKIWGEADPPDHIRWRWNLPDESFVVGLAGRLEPPMGQETLLRAAALLIGRIPGLTVMLVGAETAGQKCEEERLKRLVRKLAPSLPVIFTGYQSPPGCIIPGFDVAVLASRKEAFGRVVVEAMALGVPVIGTDAGGVPEIISDRINGLLAPSDDPPALAAAIEKLYRSRELRAEMIREGLKTVADKFSIRTHLDGLETALRGE